MMVFGWLLAILGLGTLAYQFGWRPEDRRGTDDQARSALDILRERYARGEITREQYEEMRRELST